MKKLHTASWQSKKPKGSGLRRRFPKASWAPRLLAYQKKLQTKQRRPPLKFEAPVSQRLLGPGLCVEALSQKAQSQFWILTFDFCSFVPHLFFFFFFCWNFPATYPLILKRLFVEEISLLAHIQQFMRFKKLSPFFFFNFLGSCKNLRMSGINQTMESRHLNVLGIYMKILWWLVTNWVGKSLERFG